MAEQEKQTSMWKAVAVTLTIVLAGVAVVWFFSTIIGAVHAL